MLLSNAPLFYPSARKWMWNYCIYLGPFTNSIGKNYDLGVFMLEKGSTLSCSAAIVYGDEDGNYLSGGLDFFVRIPGNDVYNEHYDEVRKRALFLGLVTEDFKTK